jgi:hypothetical protein
MTVCIAAASEGGRKIVTATDGLLTGSGVTSDLPIAKCYWFGPWQLLWAGSSGDVGSILEEFRTVLSEEPARIKREHIKGAISEAYSRFITKVSTYPVLSPWNMSVDYFTKHGRREFGTVVFQRMAGQIAENQARLDSSILLVGWGKAKASALIFEINSSAFASHDLGGAFEAIGSGKDIARSYLLLLGQTRDSSLSETLYNVAAAKFMAEKSQGQFVGETTTMHVSWKSESDDPERPAGNFLEMNEVDALRKIWEEHGRPRTPSAGRSRGMEIAQRITGGK